MVEQTKQHLLKHIAELQEQYSLKHLSPLGVGGVADYYTVAKDTVQLAAAVKAALDAELPYLVIGNASSVLFSDGGFPGLLIKNETSQYVLANDRSQMVVDSGMSLRHFITHTAGQGFGGMTHLYREDGTMGAAVYSNISRDGHSILSLVRHLTLVMPPTRIRQEPTIVRYRADWLLKAPEGFATRLQWMKKESPYEPQPVILNVHFQLTSVRPDELFRRINREVSEVEEMTPTGSTFGPIFQPLPGVEVEDLLHKSRASRLRVGGVYVDREYPNYIRARGRNIRAEQVAELMTAMQEKVREVYSVDLVPRIELLGAW